MGTIRDILRYFHEEGLSCRQTAAILSVSASTVSRVLRRAESAGLDWPLAAEVDAEALLASVYPAPARAEDAASPEQPNCEEIFASLEKPRDKRRSRMTRRKLWETYRDDVRSRGGVALSYSRFCHLLKARQPAGSGEGGEMVYEYFPGHTGLSDYSGKTLGVRQPDGSVKDVEIFIAVLCYSRLLYVEAVPDQTARSWSMAHRSAFEYFGGVPTERWSSDNLKAGVIRPGWENWELNPTFAECTRHYGVPVIPALPGNVRERAPMESMVQSVQHRILLPLQERTFFSLGEMNRAIREKLEELNDAPMSTWRVSRRQRFEEERPFLRPLPATAWEWGEWLKRIVGPNDHVQVDRTHCSVPPMDGVHAVWVRAGEHVVEVYRSRYGERLTVHLRLSGVNRYATQASHMRPLQRRIRDRLDREAKPADYREWLLRQAGAIGSEALQRARASLASRDFPQQAYRTVRSMLDLAGKHEMDAVEVACGRCLPMGHISRSTC